MRIEFTRVAAISGQYAYRPTQRPSENGGPSRQGDSVHLSRSVTTIRAAQAAAAAAPDTRAERVATIRNQVQGGTYQMDNTQVAEKLLSAL